MANIYKTKADKLKELGWAFSQQELIYGNDVHLLIRDDYTAAYQIGNETKINRGYEYIGTDWKSVDYEKVVDAIRKLNLV